MEALISGEFLKCRQTFHLKVFPFRQEFELSTMTTTSKRGSILIAVNMAEGVWR